MGNETTHRRIWDVESELWQLARNTTVHQPLTESIGAGTGAADGGEVGVSSDPQFADGLVQQF